MAMDLWNIRASLNTASLTKDGRIRMTRFFTGTAPLLKDQSLWVKYRLTSMPQNPPPVSLQKSSATLDGRESYPTKRKRSVAGSRKRFGATTSPRMSSLWMGRNNLAGFGVRMQGTVSLRVSQLRNMHAVSRQP